MILIGVRVIDTGRRYHRARRLGSPPKGYANWSFVCMDEQPVQLFKETRPPIAATKQRPRRVDYEYEWAGRASVFRFGEPLGGLAAGDGAGTAYEGGLGRGVRRLLAGLYAECTKIIRPPGLRKRPRLLWSTRIRTRQRRAYPILQTLFYQCFTPRDSVAAGGSLPYRC